MPFLSKVVSGSHFYDTSISGTVTLAKGQVCHLAQ